MAVAFDAVGPSASGAGGTSISSLSWTHTNVASGVKLLIGCSLDNTSDTGITMTAKVDTVLQSSFATKESDALTAGFAQAWNADGLAAGARTILVTASAAVADLEGGSVSLTGAAAGNPVAVTNSGTSVTASAVVTGTAATSLIFGFVAAGDVIASTTSPATSRFVNNLQGSGGNATGNCAGSTSAGGGSVTMSWGLTASVDPWAVIAAEIPAGTAVTPAMPSQHGIARRRRRQRQQMLPPPPPPPGIVPGAAALAGAGSLGTAAALGAGTTLAGAGSLTATPTRYITGLGGSGYNSYFTDNYGKPALLVLEQAWMLPTNAGRWNGLTAPANWQADIDTYFSTRAGQGYTAWYGIPWDNAHIDSGALSGGRTWDGIYPLLVNGTAGAIATGTETIALNSTFWTRIDYLFNSALKNGITCFLNMSQSYDISSAGGVWQHATNTQGTAFGNALATRYPLSSFPNVQWFWGDDDDGPNDSFYQAILNGMAAAGDTRTLFSDEQFASTNCHIEFDNKTAFGGTFGVPNARYNWVYCYSPPYNGVEDSYTEGGTFTHIPPVWGDGPYYGDTASGSNADNVLRSFTWWALASGARGFNNTSGPSDLAGSGVWRWQTGAAAALATDPNGSWITGHTKLVANYFTGLADWHKLIPDTGSAFVTAGRGTKATPGPPGETTNYAPSDTYVAASITPAGTLAVIYCRSHFSITVLQSMMVAGYTATFVDPASLATTSTTPGSTYNSTPLGNNSAGDPDWVLVLQAPPVTAGVATLAGTGSLSTAAALGAPGTLGGTGSLGTIAGQGAGTVLGAAGSLATPAVQLSPAALAGTGSLATAVTQAAGIVLGGAGSLATAVTQGSSGTLGGTGSVAAPAVIGAGTVLGAQGSLTLPAVQGSSGTLGGQGAVAAPAVIQGAGATLAGTGSLTGTGTAGGASGATLAAAGSLATAVIQGAGAVLGGTGSLVTAVTQLPAGITLAGAGSFGALDVTGAPAALGGTGSLATAAALGAGSSLAAAGALTASAVQRVPAVLTGAGSLAAAGGPAGAAVLAGTAAITGTGVVSGGAAAALGATGSLGTAAVLSTGIVLAAAASLAAGPAQGAGTALAGTGALLALGTQHPPQVKGSSTGWSVTRPFASAAAVSEAAGMAAAVSEVASSSSGVS